MSEESYGRYGVGTIAVCSICKGNYVGYGNNAYPVNDGRCCDECNREVVIQARIRAMYAKKEESK